jgi:hypothetical protein
LAGDVLKQLKEKNMKQNLGTVNVVALKDDQVRITMNMSDDEQPLCLIDAGRI